LRKY